MGQVLQKVSDPGDCILKLIAFLTAYVLIVLSIPTSLKVLIEFFIEFPAKPLAKLLAGFTFTGELRRSVQGSLQLREALCQRSRDAVDRHGGFRGCFQSGPQSKRFPLSGRTRPQDVLSSISLEVLLRPQLQQVDVAGPRAGLAAFNSVSSRTSIPAEMC